MSCKVRVEKYDGIEKSKQRKNGSLQLGRNVFIVSELTNCPATIYSAELKATKNANRRTAASSRGIGKSQIKVIAILFKWPSRVKH